MGWAYYNEWDAYACEWLNELIAHGLIAPGVVDGRSITEVQPEDLEGFTQCHFFAGIGGWSLAFRLAGVPDDRRAWSGSCPCQPFSNAGGRLGEDDERHLWPVFADLIRKYNERYGSVPEIFGEQVASKLGRDWLTGVRADMVRMGYVFGAADLPAAGVGAPHIRQRLCWGGWLEQSASDGRQQRWSEPGGRSVEQRRGEERMGDAALNGVGPHSGQPRPGDGQQEQARGPSVPCAEGLADTERDTRGPGRTSDQPGESTRADRTGAHAQLGRCGDAGRLGEPDSSGRTPGQPSTETTGHGRAAGTASSSGSRLADADGGLSRDGVVQRSREHGQQPENSGTGNGGLGDADSTGPQGRRLDVGEHSNQWTPWSASLFIRCADGQYRRVPANEKAEPEPSLQPLAHGFPGRVGLLRGSGNAIVPYQQAKFVKAFYEAIEEHKASG